MTRIEAQAAIEYYLGQFRADVNKYDRGRVFVIAGSRGMSGAAILSARAAMRSGAGLVYSVLPGGLLPGVEPALLEALKCPVGDPDKGYFAAEDAARLKELAARADAVVLGPGLGRNESTLALVQELVADPEFAPDARAIILDADGLYAFKGRASELAEAAARRNGQFILTPHEGEMAGLLELTAAEVRAERAECVTKLAELLGGGAAVLKGRETLTATFSRTGAEIYVNTAGGPGLATGGSGDVLAGLIAGLAASDRARAGNCQPLINIVNYGVALHGLAGDILTARRGVRYLTAGDIIEGLGEIRNYAG
ncbi:MAG: NAD(P)H-hydrate dehydratase [Clostridia bacterium]|nr:NAD(P)H-hydrate dehydratase [Clostridia bacterium]